MAIVFPLDFPTVSAPYKITWRDLNVVGVSEAPFSLKQQVQEFQGQRWEGDLSFRPMEETIGRQMVAFFRSLRGRSGTFLFADPRYSGPLGAASLGAGSPEVDGGGQTGLVLAIKTTGIGTTANYLKAGDLLSYGTGTLRRMHAVTKDMTITGDVGTVDIWPRLRDSPVDGTALDLLTPTGRFRLSQNVVEYDEDEVGNITLATMPIVEDLST